MTDQSYLVETLMPADPDAVADAVRAAGEKGLAVYPIGGGTRKGDGPHLPEQPFGCFAQMGSVPFSPQPGLGLSTAKLNRVIDYPADDMTVTVEAGLTVGELNRLLAENHQWLPVDVPWPDRATVGGAIATNAAGPRQYAYGTIRDYLLGFTAVDGTGTIFSGGGRVVKNAAGYNMCRLMAGSLGTLGVLTQVTLMVRPLPETAALLACDVRDFELAECLLADLIRSPVRPVAVELSAGRSRENNPLFGPVLEGNVGRLYVGFEGPAAEVEWMLGRLREDWTAAGMISPMLLPELADDRFWQWMSEFPADSQIDVLPSQTVETIAEVLKSAPDCAIQAHAGDGVIFINGIGPRLQHQRLAPDGTSAHGCGDTPAQRITRALKDRFDPQNLLNPGRLFDEQPTEAPA